MNDELCSSGKLWDEVGGPSGVHDNYVYAALFKGICKFSDWNEAYHLLYNLVDCGVLPNVVCYNIVIVKAYRLGLKKEAYQILEEMKNNGVVHDSVMWRILDKFMVWQWNDVKVKSFVQFHDEVEEGVLYD